MARYNSLKNQRSLYQQQSGVCNGCMGPLKLRHLAVDHVVPRKEGGTHEFSNLQLLCASCNSVKGKRSHSYLTRRLKDRNWTSRRPGDSKVHALVWNGSRWVDVFELLLYVDDPDSCSTRSVKGKTRPLFPDQKVHELAWKNMRKGLLELVEILDSKAST